MQDKTLRDRTGFARQPQGVDAPSLGSSEQARRVRRGPGVTMRLVRVESHHPNVVTDAERVLKTQYSPARTKLLIPELPNTHVPRPRLVRHLDESVAAFAITLVAGFAGSGKTVLLAEFSRSASPGNTAWLSCDVTDADPVRFWAAFVAYGR